MDNKKPEKKPRTGDHRVLDEDGEIFDDPWMWVDDVDEEEVKSTWRQGTGTDLTPRKE